MAKCPFRRLVLFPMFLISAVLWAQSASQKPYGEVVYADGSEFTVVREGVVNNLRVDDAEALGYRLEAGDLIQTANATFLEISLEPRGDIIKIAENSSFFLSAIGGELGDISLDMLYGRVRAKVGKLSGGERFRIRNDATVAGVRGTDFGFDVVIQPTSPISGALNAPLVKVYCFDGEVEVTPLSPPVSDESASVDPHSPSGSVLSDTTAATSPTYIVKANELLTVDVSMSIPTIERKQVDDELKSYWRENDYKTAPSAPALLETKLEQVAAAPVTITEYIQLEPDYTEIKKAASQKNNIIGGAIIFGVFGLGLQAVGIAASVLNNPIFSNAFMYAGSVGIGVSLVTLGFALSVPIPTP